MFSYDTYNVSIAELAVYSIIGHHHSKALVSNCHTIYMYLWNCLSWNVSQWELYSSENNFLVIPSPKEIQLSPSRARTFLVLDLTWWNTLPNRAAWLVLLVEGDLGRLTGSALGGMCTAKMSTGSDIIAACCCTRHSSCSGYLYGVFFLL